MQQLLGDGVPIRQLPLVLFYCDGVLVDIEMLSAGILIRMMVELGLPVTHEIFPADFLGRSSAFVAKRVMQRFGLPLSEKFHEGYRERMFA